LARKSDIRLRRSAVSGSVPSTADLNLGELAINTYDGKLFLKKDVTGTETVVEVGGNKFGTIAVSGQSDIVADSTNDTLTFAAGSGMTITTDASTDTITLTSVASSQSAVWKEYVYTATSGQTSFSGTDDNSQTLSYVAGYLQVFLNGVLLDNGTDYTATNGTSVVLVNGASASDLVQIATFVKVLGTGDIVVNSFTGDGSTAAYTLTADPDTEDNTTVFVDGVYQEKDTYTVSGTTLTFDANVPNGASIEILIGSKNVTLSDVNDLSISGDLTVAGESTFTGVVTAQDEFVGDLDGAIQTPIRNTTGSTIYKGQAVYVTGLSGDTPTVALARANSASTMPAVGIARADINNNATGQMTVLGTLEGIDTSGSNNIETGITLSVNDVFYVSATEAGRITNVAPTGEANLIQNLGTAVRVSPNTNMTFSVKGAGRSNATPNLNTGRLFVGNASNQAVADDTLYVDIANSRVGIGTTSPSSKLTVQQTGIGSVTSLFDIVAETTATASTLFDFDHYGSGNGSSQIRFRKATGTIASPTIAGANQACGRIGSLIYDGAAFYDNTLIRFATDGTPALNSTPGRIEFYTAAAGSAGAIAERMRIDSSGNLLVGTTDDSPFDNSSNTSADNGIALRNDGILAVAAWKSTANVGNVVTANRTGTDGSILGFQKSGTSVGSIGTISGYLTIGTNDTGLIFNDVSNAIYPWNVGTNGASDGLVDLGFSNRRFQDLYLSGTITNNGTGGISIDTSGNVGIGTTSPNANLHVLSSGNGEIEVERASGALINLQAQSARGVIGTDSNHDLQLKTNAGVRMTIDTDGNVGIGTTSPAAKIDVVSSSANLGRFAATNGYIDLVDPAVTGRLQVSGNVFYMGTTASGDMLAFKTDANTERVRIDSAGNVGIGTTSPSYLLHVSASSPIIASQDTDGTNQIGRFFQSGADLVLNSRNNTSRGSFSFDSSNGTDTVTRLKIDASGNVGINATPKAWGSSWRSLTINSTARTSIADTSGSATFNYNIYNDGTNNRYIDSTGAGRYRINGNTHSWDIFASGTAGDVATFTTPMTINGSGNVGIGTTSPDATLDAVGSINVAGQFTSTATSKSNGTYTLMVDSSAHTSNLSTAGAMSVDVNSGRAFTITGQGNVGIGTTSPAYLLSIEQSSPTLQLKTTNTSGTNTILFSDSESNFVGNIKYDHSDNSLSFATSSSTNERMRIDSSGNVGIGTSSPSRTLDVRGVGVAANLQSTSTAGGLIDLKHAGTAASNAGAYNGIRFYNGDGFKMAMAHITEASGSGYLQFGTNWAADTGDIMAIHQSGKVGIGTTSPNYELTVGGSDAINSIQLLSSTTGTGANNGLRFWNTGSSVAMWNYDNTPTLFGTSGTERLRILSDGAACFGTTSSRPAEFTHPDGFAIRYDTRGQFQNTVTSAPCGIINRDGTDGDLLLFRKEGTAVGGIGTTAGYAYYNGSQSGIDFYGVNALPTSGGTNVAADAVTSLGNSNFRFKDLYLSGGAYLGGTVAANKLDDYEEGDYEVTITCGTSGTVSLNTAFNRAAYTKVGRLVTVHGFVVVDSVSSPVGFFQINLPFTPASLTDRAGDAAVSLGLQNVVSANISDFVGMLNEGVAKIYVQLGDANTLQNDSAQQIAANTYITFSATYSAA